MAGIITIVSDTIQHVYEHAIANDWQWRFDGELRRPAYEDVELLLTRMVEEVRKAQGSISMSSGGILVQKVDGYIDIYTHVAGIKE